MKNLIFITILIFFFTSVFSKNVVVIIIDGARYSETFGDSTHKNIPKLFELSKKGSLLTSFYNDSITKTAFAIPALWTGSWTQINDTLINGNKVRYAVNPTIFEYFRKENFNSENNCFYILKHVESLWLQSFNSDYGQSYWAKVISMGEDDKDVYSNTVKAIRKFHPNFIWIYFDSVDYFGDKGNWNGYLKAISRIDKIVYNLWQIFENDNFYKDNTTLFITNDHGRHNDYNGGFQKHGCNCYGCRHIMFLALGNEIKQDYISDNYHTITDLTPTICNLLKLKCKYSTGKVITEIFK